MIRKMLLVVGAIVLMAGMVYADEAAPTTPVGNIISMLPATKTGVMINCAKGQGNVFVGVEEAEICSYKGISANLGVSSTLNNEGEGLVCASLNYNLGALKSFGVNVPAGDNIEIGLAANRNFGTQVFGYGPAMMCKLKF